MTTKTYPNKRGTVLCSHDGIPVAVVLGHSEAERDYTTDEVAFLVEAAELTAPDWTHDVGVLKAVANWIAQHAEVAPWHYANDDDLMEGDAEDESWCGPGYGGDEVWVMTWDGDAAVGEAETIELASIAEDD